MGIPIEYLEVATDIISLPETRTVIASMTGAGVYRVYDRFKKTPKKEVEQLNRIADEIVNSLFDYYNNNKRKTTPEIFNIAIRIKAKTNRLKLHTSPFLRIGEILELLLEKISETKGFPHQEQIITALEQLIAEWNGNQPDPPKGFFKGLLPKKRQLTENQKKFIDPNGRGNWLYYITIKNEVFLVDLFIVSHINLKEGLNIIRNGQNTKRIEKDIDLNNFISWPEKACLVLIFITDDDGITDEGIQVSDNEECKFKYIMMDDGGMLQIIPTTFETIVTVTEQVLIKKDLHQVNKSFGKLPYCSKTVSEQVLTKAKDAYIIVQAVPAEHESQTVPDVHETVTEQVLAKIEREYNSIYSNDSSTQRSYWWKDNSKEEHITQSGFNLKYLREKLKLSINEWESLRTFGAGGHSSYENHSPRYEKLERIIKYHKSHNSLRNAKQSFVGLTYAMVMVCSGIFEIANFYQVIRQTRGKPIRRILNVWILCIAFGFVCVENRNENNFIQRSFYSRTIKLRDKRGLSLNIPFDPTSIGVLIRDIIREKSNYYEMENSKGFKPIIFIPLKDVLVREQCLEAVGVNDFGLRHRKVEERVDNLVTSVVTGSDFIEKNRFFFSQN